MLLTTHAPDDVLRCDRVVVLAPGGRLAFDGAPEAAAPWFGVPDLGGVYAAVAAGVVDVEPEPSVDVVEPVGAGDSFAAGYLSGMLFGLDQKASLRRGHVAAACTLTVHGDRGPLPEAAQLAAILASTDAEWAAIRVADGHFNTRTGA